MFMFYLLYYIFEFSTVGEVLNHSPPKTSEYEQSRGVATSQSKLQLLAPEVPDATTTPSEIQSIFPAPSTGKQTEHLEIFLTDTRTIPEEFEVRTSRLHSGPGVWSRVRISCLQRFGPFRGVLRPRATKDPSSWEVSSPFVSITSKLDSLFSSPNETKQFIGSWFWKIFGCRTLCLSVVVDRKVFYKW